MLDTNKPGTAVAHADINLARILLLLPLSLCCLGRADASTQHWVDAGAGPGGDGGRDRPFATINAAVQAAAAGDQILVMAGRYPDQVLIENKRGLTLTAVDDAVELIAPQFKMRINNAVGVTISGFAFVGGEDGALVESSQVEFKKCRFEDIHQYAYHAGAGVVAWSSKLTVRDSAFSRSWGGQSGGAVGAYHTDLVFEGNLVDDCDAWACGAGVDFEFTAGSPRCSIRENIFVGCQADYSGAIHVEGENIGSLLIERNLFVGNGSDHRVGGQVRLSFTGHGLVLNNTFVKTQKAYNDKKTVALWFEGAPQAEVTNCLFYETDPKTIAIHAEAGSSVDVDYSLSCARFEGVRIGSHTFCADPLFADSEAGDFTLRPGSPAINAGHPELSDSDGRSDIGWRPAVPQSLLLRDGRFRVDLTWEKSDGTTGVAQGVALTSESGYFSFLAAGNIELSLKILDGQATNGRMWVFYAALTDVAWTLTITDLRTGATRIYEGQPGVQTSGHDLEAF